MGFISDEEFEEREAKIHADYRARLKRAEDEYQAVEKRALKTAFIAFVVSMIASYIFLSLII